MLLPTWGWLIPAVFGFNARWLPTFLGLRAPDSRYLYSALVCAWIAILIEWPASRVFPPECS